MLKILLPILFLVSSYAVARDPVIINCKPTLEIKHPENMVPKYFQTSNNLLRKNNEFYTATGKPVLISGRLTDAKCVPIADAKVYIWHQNIYDKNQYSQDAEFRLKSNAYDPYFNGSGTTTTDNLGRFAFISILPEKSKNPNVNFIVKHKDFDTFHTKMFFSPQNDRKLKSLVAKVLKPTEKIGSGNYNNYEFNIRLSKNNLFVSY